MSAEHSPVIKLLGQLLRDECDRRSRRVGMDPHAPRKGLMPRQEHCQESKWTGQRLAYFLRGHLLPRIIIRSREEVLLRVPIICRPLIVHVPCRTTDVSSCVVKLARSLSRSAQDGLIDDTVVPVITTSLTGKMGWLSCG